MHSKSSIGLWWTYSVVHLCTGRSLSFNVLSHRVKFSTSPSSKLYGWIFTTPSAPSNSPAWSRLGDIAVPIHTNSLASLSLPLENEKNFHSHWLPGRQQSIIYIHVYSHVYRVIQKNAPTFKKLPFQHFPSYLIETSEWSISIVLSD